MKKNKDTKSKELEKKPEEAVNIVKEIIKDEEVEKKIKIKPIKRTQHEQIRVFSNFIKKAGINSNFAEINSKILLASSVLSGSIALFIIIDFILKKSFFFDALSFFVSTVFMVAIVSYIFMWACLFIYVDYRIYKRRQEIEQVFPDFLQLTAANINAGMPTDRALWFAIRPKFGILAKEMEGVAKSTMVGENLNKALVDFSNRYDSITVKRALNLLIEGLESGGEIGDLLTRVANNMRETEILKKEMASGVTTYVIFILSATLGAAPFLFGLTTELIVIMTSIMSKIVVGTETSSMGGIGSMLSAGGNSISLLDYQIFAITSICISSTFAAIIISVIQKGEVKEAFKKIPLFVFVGVVNYFIAFKVMNYMLGGFFS